jgi:hypothetical protein
MPGGRGAFGGNLAPICQSASQCRNVFAKRGHGHAHSLLRVQDRVRTVADIGRVARFGEMIFDRWCAIEGLDVGHDYQSLRC